MKKHLLLFVLTIMGLQALNAQTWTKIDAGTTSTLNDVFFYQCTGWIIGDYGIVLKSTDNGNTWADILQGGYYGGADAIYFTDATTGFMVVETGGFINPKGEIFKTTDGGANWASVYVSTTGFYRDITFLDANTGWAVGDAGAIVKTTDGGTTWTMQTSGITQRIRNISIIDANTAFISTDYTTQHSGILKTTDGGSTWVDATPGNQYDTYGMYFVDANNGWATALNGNVFNTTDGGANWSITTLNGGSSIYSIHFANTQFGMGTGYQGHIAYTTDGGSTWTENTTEATSTMEGAFCINEHAAIVVGLDGTIIRYSDGSEPALPVAAFSADVTSGDAPLTVTFTDASTGGPTSWSWDFNNDGAEDATTQNPSYEYTTAGTYTVTLVVTNGAGTDTLTKTDYITVNPPLNADFSADNTSGTAPFTVTFTDASTGSPTTWSWDFNNDGIEDATTQNPDYTFTEVGTYTVSLTITKGDKTDTETKTDYITISSTPVVSADFSASTTSGTAPLTVNFTDLSTENPTSWSWDFDNDGTEDSNEQNPSYTYTTAGTYTVSLTVSDGTSSDTETKTDYITITEGTATCIDPTDYVMNFEASDDLTGWMFIDNNKDDNSWITFSEKGINNSYCAGYNYSSTNAADDWLISPCVDFKAGKNYEISFYYASAGSAITEKLAFYMGPDVSTNMTLITDIGEFANQEYTKVTQALNFTEDATYHFGWKCYSDADSWAVMIDSVHITEVEAAVQVEAGLQADVTSGQAPLEVHFTDLSSGNPTSWNWDFDNDGTIDSNDQNPTYTYNNAGTYTVKLTVSNGSTSDEIIISDLITVSGVGVAESAKNPVNIYPNPASGYVTIKLSDHTATNHIEIYNTEGLKVMAIPASVLSNDSYTFDTHTLSKGLYFVKVTDQNGIHNSKLIIQ